MFWYTCTFTLPNFRAQKCNPAALNDHVIDSTPHLQLQLCHNKMLKKSWTCSFLIFGVRLLFNVTVIWGHVFIYFESNNPWNSVIREGPQIASISPTCQSCYTRIKFNTLVLADSQRQAPYWCLEMLLVHSGWPPHHVLTFLGLTHFSDTKLLLIRFIINILRKYELLIKQYSQFVQLISKPQRKA